MFNELMKATRERFARRVRYNRMIGEINGLTQRDLADMGADRTELLRYAHAEVYGR